MGRPGGGNDITIMMIYINNMIYHNNNIYYHALARTIMMMTTMTHINHLSVSLFRFFGKTGSSRKAHFIFLLENLKVQASFFLKIRSSGKLVSDQFLAKLKVDASSFHLDQKCKNILLDKLPDGVFGKLEGHANSFQINIWRN